MSVKPTVVLEIGSSQIRMIVGKRGVNGTFNILSKVDIDYSGYSDGEFIDIYETRDAIALAKKRSEDTCGMEIKSLYVGVPAEFSTLATKKIVKNSGKRFRVTKEYLDSFYTFAQDSIYKNSHTLINCSASYFTLDDNRRVLNALKQKTSSLSALVSCIYVENKFIQLINGYLSQIGIEYVEYISEPQSEAAYLIGSADKDNFALVVDVGYSSSMVYLVRGEGLLMLQSFSYGGAHIDADLAEYLEIPFKSAGELKNKVSLSISPQSTDYYELKIKDKIHKFSMELVNSIICCKIDFFAQAINACIKMCREEYPEYISLGLTGGGISYIKGAKDYLAKAIGRNVDLLVPQDPARNKPNWSATLGLFATAISKSEKNKKNFYK